MTQQVMEVDGGLERGMGGTLKIERSIHRKREKHREGEMSKAHTSSFVFPFIILSPALLFLSSLHSEKTNKNIRDTTGWRGVNRREWRRDTDQFQQWLCHRNTMQTDKVILKVMTHTKLCFFCS